MATNVHFSKGTISEQYLYEDLVIEAIGIYGHDVYYLPRERVNEDELLGNVYEGSETGLQCCCDCDAKNYCR